MPILSAILRFHDEISRKAAGLRAMADPGVTGVIPAMDAGKLFADAEFSANLRRLRSAFRPLNVARVGSWSRRAKTSSGS